MDNERMLSPQQIRARQDELFELGQRAMKEVMEKLGTVRRPDAGELLKSIAIASITALRINLGDDYAAEFLRQAIEAIEQQRVGELRAAHSH